MAYDKDRDTGGPAIELNAYNGATLGPLPNTAKRSFDPNKPVRTLAGQPARIIATDRKGAYPIIALVLAADSVQENVMAYDIRGIGLIGFEASTSLVNIPETFEFTRWVNIYEALDTKRIWIAAGLNETRHQAEKSQGSVGSRWLGAFPVTIKGEF